MVLRPEKWVNLAVAVVFGVAALIALMLLIANVTGEPQSAPHVVWKAGR